MSKYLLVSLSTGGGHRTAANSLADKLENRGHETRVIDLFQEIDEKGLHTIICGGYNFIATKAPKMYGAIYRTGNKPTFAKTSFDLVRRICQRKIIRYMEIFQPDVIISVHPIVTDILGGMKEKGYLGRSKLASVITDYLPHFVYVRKHKQIDAYFVGAEITKNDLLARGVANEKIHVNGIPIKEDFYSKGQSESANKAFTILVMGGSLGSNNMKKVIDQIMIIKREINVLIVCGKDEVLYRKMEKYQYQYSNKHVRVFGFTNDIFKLMDQSDLLISKPGGASVTEALLRRIPMIIPYSLGGQERENLDYLVKENVALNVSNIKDINQKIEYLIENPIALTKMREKMGTISTEFSIDRTITDIENL